ncbi:Methyltransferase-like protein 22 [Collichthys lucidus]|uniref:Methyltransferase-like protein 22 n=1 Tax=Collichthys lucidus TaxID=240159 RepID=A0A4U5VIK7_COLLU|nr:Methyltransferase-like protein 22 [Collichthys lucidus]
MEQISFHHDTVLSDVHMLLPNGRRLMTRLNCVGQPVFTSYFKMLSDGEKHDNGKDLKKADKYNDPRKDSERDTKATQGKDGEDGEEGNLEQFMDEDGDLDIHYRPWKTPTEGSGRDLVCPVILKQSNPVLEQEEETMADEVDTCFRDIIRIVVPVGVVCDQFLSCGAYWCLCVCVPAACVTSVAASPDYTGSGEVLSVVTAVGAWHYRCLMMAAFDVEAFASDPSLIVLDNSTRRSAHSTLLQMATAERDSVTATGAATAGDDTVQTAGPRRHGAKPTSAMSLLLGETYSDARKVTSVTGLKIHQGKKRCLGKQSQGPCIDQYFLRSNTSNQSSEVQRRDKNQSSQSISTPVTEEGNASTKLQVWRGAFFLADFILSDPIMFRGATVLELGAGTGLTSIILATIAKTVYCTDVGEDLLRMCKRNVMLNRHMMEPSEGSRSMRPALKLSKSFDLQTTRILKEQAA